MGQKCGTICFLVILLGSACARTVPTPDPVTITFAHADADTEYFETVISAFSERRSHITVELRPRPQGQLLNLRGSDADVFMVHPFALRDMLDNGDILNLDPWIAQDSTFDSADFFTGLMAAYRREGKTWAIPATADPLVMFYNQDLFDEHGAAYPETNWTWDDFLDRALALRDPVSGVYGYWYRPDALDPYMFIYQHGGRVFDDLQKPTRTTFDDPLTIEALEWYVGLMYDHDVAPSPDTAREAFGGRQQAFYMAVLRSKLGMWMGHFSERGGLAWWQGGEWGFGWGMAPLPRDAHAATVMEGGAVYAISSQAQDAKACWQWIAFLSRQVPNRMIPARISLAESDAFQQQVGSGVAAAARSSMEDALVITLEWGEEEIAKMESFSTALGRIVNGEMTPEEGMAWAQHQAEE